MIGIQCNRPRKPSATEFPFPHVCFPFKAPFPQVRSPLKLLEGFRWTGTVGKGAHELPVLNAGVVPQSFYVWHYVFTPPEKVVRVGLAVLATFWGCGWNPRDLHIQYFWMPMDAPFHPLQCSHMPVPKSLFFWKGACLIFLGWTCWVDVSMLFLLNCFTADVCSIWDCTAWSVRSTGLLYWSNYSIPRRSCALIWRGRTLLSRGSGVSNPSVLRDQGLLGAFGYIYIYI